MKKFISKALAVLLVITMMPISAFAASVDFNLSQSGCNYYNLIEQTDYALAPGATESEIVINDDTGSNRNVMHVIEVDLTNPNISVMPTYMGLEEGIDFEDSSVWQTGKLTDQAAHVENNLGLNVVGGINTNLRYGNNHPYGVLVWNGVVYSDERNTNGSSTAQTFLSVTKDGVASLHSASEAIPEDSYNAISANFSWIIKDGVSQYKTDDHADASRAPRTVIGIKESGELILMMNDGRQAPFSAGMTMRELAEVLLAMGCVDAVNCDGGGSSTFISEREGTGELTMKSSPSDGGQRATLGGLLVISKAVADGKFDHATIKADSESKYITPGSSVGFTAVGADSAGGPADIPEDISWQLADSTMGTVEDGIFTSNGTVGEVVVQMVYNGEVVGEDTVNVVIPETITFAQTNMTVPFGKTAQLAMKATINDGLNTVVLKDGDVEFTLSDEKLGTISGFSYTACDAEAGVDTGTVTAVLTHDKTKTATASIKLGKGSEVVWDFEDGDISALSFGTGYGSKHPAHKELGRFEKGYLEVVDSTTGQVKNGEKALAVVCDWSGFYAMGYNMLRLSGLGIDMTDAVGVGFWAYITPEATGAEFDLNNAIPFNSGDAGSDAYPEDGWYYIYAAKDDGVGETFNNLSIYHTDGYDSAQNLNIANIKTKHTVYIDDITVDYSTVVSDREAPEFTSVYIAGGNDTYIEMEGQTVSSDTITVMADTKENTSKGNYTGLDIDSAKVYVDGVKLEKGYSCSSSGTISVDSIKLSEGIHTFRFEIADNAGNYRSVTRQVVIDATEDAAKVEFVPHDASLTNLPIGSMYWMDLKVSDIENIESISAELNLDGMNDWQLDHMVVANGFEVEYTVDDHTNDATLEITKTGKVNATGEAVVASIPIHVWEFTLHIDYPDCISDGAGVCNFISTPDKMWAGDGNCRIAIMVSVDRGEVVFADDSTDTFSSENYVVDTELNKHRNLLTQTEKDSKTSWHIHTPVAVEDKAATCTEDGYTGRTVCAGCSCGNTEENPCDTFDGCGSVVDWGETIEATGHTYKVIDGKLQCECGAVNETTGFVTIDGNTYYAINGNLSSGWVVEKGNYYYFDLETYAAKRDGVHRIENYDYTFNADGILTAGQWVRVISNGEFEKKYIFAGKYIVSHFRDIEGKTYWFDKNGFMATGTQVLKLSGGDKGAIYEIGADGVVAGVIDYTGSYTCQDTVYGVINGKLIDEGFFVNDGNTYFCNNDDGILSTGKVYIDDCYATDIITSGWHYFDETGRMYDEEFVNYGGSLYYMVDGQPGKTGVFTVDDSLYYAEWNGIVKTGKVTITDENSNGLLEAGVYYFSETGKLCNNEFVEDNGDIYYVVDGQSGKTGVFAVDNSLYYASWKGVIQTGKIYVTEATTNGLIEAGWYYTNDAGRMYNDEFIEIDGNIYYMVNGQSKNKTGIVEIESALYYLDSKGVIQTGKIYVTEATTNGLVEAGWYYTNEAGKLYNNEFATIDSKLYYMVNGQPKKQSGVVEIEGSLYCAEWNGAIRIGKIYITTESSNGLVDAGWYYTDETGKMYNNEFTMIDGDIYYMVNGQPKKQSGVVEIDGSLYCAEWNGAIRIGKIYITEESSNGIVAAGWHYTDETGRMYNNEFTTIDNKIYYMSNGQPKKQSGVVEIDGSLYCAEWNGAIRTGKIYITEESSNGLVDAGWHYTDETGRMYNEEVAEIDGKLYYLINGQPGKKSGVVKVGNSLYYVEWSGLVKTGKVYITQETTNELTSEGWHYTDESGRMYNEEFAEIDGDLYYILNGQIAKLGVFELDGSLYYADTWNGKIARDGKIYVTVDSANNLINWGFHIFSAEGKMIS